MRTQGKGKPRRCRGTGLFRSLTIFVFTFGSPFAQAGLDVQVRGLVDPIEVSVTVTDSDGVPITGLDSNRFSIVENDVPRAVDGVSVPAGQALDDEVSLSAVFVMDYSGSLIAADAIEPVEEAVVSFIEAMNLGDQVAILKLNGIVTDMFGGFVQIDPADTTALAEAVRVDLAPQHGSHIFDAIIQAYDLLETSLPILPQGPKAIIVLTDGKDVESASALDDVTARLQASNIPLFPVGFGLPDVSVMTALSQSSGTAYVGGHDAEAFQLIQQQLASLLQYQYVVSYDSSAAPGDCTPTVLTVTVDAGLPSEQTAQTSFTRCPRDNAAPTIQSITRKQFKVGRWVSLQVLAEDPDGDELTYSATGLPPGLTIDTDTGLISGVPSRVGTYVTSVSALDGGSASEVKFAADVVKTPDSGGGGAFGPYAMLLLTMGLLAARVRSHRRQGG